MLINFLRQLNFKPITKKPCLTIVGVGPGEEALLTIAAVEAIKKASIVAYPVATQGAKSIAAEIASKYIHGKKRLPLVFPMTSDPHLLKEAWHNASLDLLKLLEENKEVVLLSQGDPSLYSTSAYISLYIKSNYPKCELKVIPGINSFSAAAALNQLPLSLQKEQLLVCPVPDNKEEFEEVIDNGIMSKGVIVFLKLGERWVWVREILERKKLLDKTFFAQRIGFSDQQVALAKNISASSKPYFSLLIIRNNLPPIVP